jgi:outer membrane protein assembly factor BamC
MKSIGIALVFLSLVTGCSSLSERNKIDYKSGGKKTAPLEVPPDLAAPGSDDRYSVPDSGTATYSKFSSGQRAARAEAAPKLLVQPEGFRIERAGAERWLVVQGEPEALWDRVREFWLDNGFLIAREMPEVGLMETDWAENRAKIPVSALRKLVGMALDNIYSYPERDKFRTRIERGEEPGTSEVFITHRGMYEVLTSEGRGRDDTMWQARPTDPDLEAQMLYLLMVRLGASEETVKQAAKATPPPPRAELKTSGESLAGLHLQDSFDRAWRRVGLALDRIGFTVEDRDRSKGLYYVRYLDPDADAKKRSGLGRLAFWRDDEVARDAQFQISVQDLEQGSEVKVLNPTGEVEKSPTAGRILALLQEELK